MPGLVAPKKCWVWGNKKEKEDKENYNAYYEAPLEANAFDNDQEDDEDEQAQVDLVEGFTPASFSVEAAELNGMEEVEFETEGKTMIDTVDK